MKQVLIRQGQAIVEDVPAPMVEPGTALVRVRYSCISTGTETSVLRSSGILPLKRVLKQPEHLVKLARVVANEGVTRGRLLVQRFRGTRLPTGYSAAGHVIEVGEGVADVRPDDRVACAGDQHAYHAEVVRIPRNLLVPVPPDLDLAEASTVALGAIALQGLRRANPQLGETFAVIGLGILGQLTVQLLKANGCRVIGRDLDFHRVELAKRCGMDAGLDDSTGDAVEQVRRLTDGVGADGVIITAASTSSAAVNAAFRMCRRRGRVVLVGDVGLTIDRADFYQKELDFLMSTSYGPGRYDRNYEERGQDYPLAYVRWTENRNMREYLRLLAEGRVDARSLVTTVYPVEEAPAAYELLRSGIPRPLCLLLSYPGRPVLEQRRIVNPAARSTGTGRVRIAVVGAGAFARSAHLPNLQAMSQRFHLQAIVSRDGHNAVAVARQFRSTYASTDYQQVLDDPDVDAVLIATRHHLHAQMALQALRAGKHVLVEKPLAITQTELQSITSFFSTLESEQTPLLMTGFNRRFAPLAQQLRSHLQQRRNPMVLTYRFNAGYLPPDHWVHGVEGGGRNLGEACHAYDLLTFLTSARVRSVFARAIRPASRHYSHADNFAVTLEFDDGSVASVTYTALGSDAYPKEQLELYVDGEVATLEDFRRLAIVGTGTRTFSSRAPTKGHREELVAFADAVAHGGVWPIPLWQQVQATDIALQIESQINPRP